MRTENPPEGRALRPWLLALVLFFFHHPFPGSGANSRLDLALALAERGTLAIDAYHENTHDKAIVGGHAYTDKAPLPSLLGAGTLLPVRWAFRLVGLTPDLRLLGYLATSLTVTLGSLLLCILLYRCLLACAPGGPRTFAVTAYALGTLAFPFSILFFSHQLAALLCLAAFLCARQRAHEPTAGVRWSAAAGLFSGLAIMSEYPTGLLAGLLFVYLASAVRKGKDLGLYLALALGLPVLALGTYNTLAFGSPLHLGYVSTAFEEYRAAHHRGLFGVTWPRPRALGLILFSPSRGLLFLSPFLVLAIPGLAAMVRDHARRREGLFFAAALALFLAFNAAYHQPGGGSSHGPRHLAPVIPFLVPPLCFWLARASRGWRVAAGVLALVAVIFTTASTAIEPLFPEQIRNPLVEFVPVLAVSGGRLDNLASLLGLPWALGLAVFFIAVTALALTAGRDLLAPRPQDATSFASRTGFLAPPGATAGILVAVGLALALVHTEPGIVHQAFGNHFSSRGEFARAVVAYRRAAEVRADPYIRFYLGRALLRLGDASAARVAYTEALQLAPDFPQAEEVRRILAELPP